MPSNSAAYMRSYRARRKAAEELVPEKIPPWPANARIAELEAEVRHLKAELAKRQVVLAPGRATMQEAGFSTRPFTPVPKTRKR